MKKINSLTYSIVLLFVLSSSLHAVGISGYVWMSTRGSLFYDSISYSDPEDNYVLKVKSKEKVFPDINSIIKINKGNRIYPDFNTIQYISKKFVFLLKERKCKNWKKSFTNFMLNRDNPQCMIDNVLKKLPDNTIRYFTIPKNVKAKILGYVEFKTGLFVFVQIIDVWENE